jgi:hypothetical protein
MARTAALDLLAERHARGKVFLREVLVHDADRRGVGGVAVVERPTLDDRDVHRLEELAADHFLATVRRRYRRLKIAVFAPIPSVSVRTATSVKTGCLRRVRRA